MGERRDACRVFWGRVDGKKQLGKPKHRWENNIKVRGMEFIDLASDWDG